MKNKIEFVILNTVILLARIIGFNRRRILAKMIALIFFYLIPLRKTTVIKNLQIAFPELDLLSIKKIAFDSYINFSTTLIEFFLIPYLSKQKIIDLVKTDKIPLAIDLYNQGKGVFLLSGHFGNWEAAGLSLALQMSIPWYLIAKPQRNNYVTEYINKQREMFGNKVIMPGQSIRELFKIVEEKNFVAIVGDQRGPIDGMRVRFFNKETSFFSGYASIAVRKMIPTLAALIVRNSDGSYSTALEVIRINNEIENLEERIKDYVQQFASFLEMKIREHPEQWFWMHKIWKY